MGISTRLSRGCATVLAALLLCCAAGCNLQLAGEQGPTEVGYSTYVLELPEKYGSPDRTPVVFDHAAHIAAVEDEGCAACHAADGKGGRFPLLAEALPQGDRDDLMNAYHDGCVSCHKQQIKAPVTCGECHRLGKPPSRRELDKQPEPFMDKLHDQHMAALNDRCGDCHHEPDAETGGLKYVEGNEVPCTECHKRDGSRSVPSLKSASHAACVGCHLGLAAEGKKTGTVECEGCHTLANQR